MKLPSLERVFYHRDYDGVVAAAMVRASAGRPLALHPVQYASSLRWLERTLGRGACVVDFLFHPDAVLWIDHHATTFANEALRNSFRPDAFHVFDTGAASCPSLIVRQPWFRSDSHWAEFVKWADVIDSAAYESAQHASDLANPHILLSNVIAEVLDEHVLASVVVAIATGTVDAVLNRPELQPIVTRVQRDEASIRSHLATLLRLDGGVAILDQAQWAIPYRRYIAFEKYPSARYAIGLYLSGNDVIVSVGENPWGEPGPLHLGDLCREFGGGGRRATAGVPAASASRAMELAASIAKRLNYALEGG